MAETTPLDGPLELGGRPAAAIAVDRRARNGIFAAVLLAMLLAGLDQTVVGTALPRIVTDLQGTDRYVWVVTAYLLSSTVSMPVYGKFSDVYGRKAMLLVGVGLFLLGSGLSGLSQTMNQLIGFRALVPSRQFGDENRGLSKACETTAQSRTYQKTTRARRAFGFGPRSLTVLTRA